MPATRATHQGIRTHRPPVRRALQLVVAWAVVSTLLMIGFALNAPWAGLCRG